jgi:hypothetical protein
VSRAKTPQSPSVLEVGQTSSDKGGTGCAQLVINFCLIGDPARQRPVIYLTSRDK